MKTAMQELIDWIECDNDNNVYDITDFAKELLEKEKEQIIDAYDRGYKACDLDEELEINMSMFSGVRYYNQTYRN